MKGEPTKQDMYCGLSSPYFTWLKNIIFLFLFQKACFQLLGFLGHHIKNHTPLQFPLIITHLILKIL